MPTRTAGHQFHPWKMPRKGRIPSEPGMAAHRQQTVEQGEQRQQQEQQDPELGKPVRSVASCRTPWAAGSPPRPSSTPLQHEGEPVEKPLLQLGAAATTPFWCLPSRATRRTSGMRCSTRCSTMAVSTMNPRGDHQGPS